MFFFSALCAAQSREPEIWTGVYTSAQAERGKTNFTTSCARCHLADLSGGAGPSLKGERFIKAWENENLYRLFTKIRDTMPPNFGTTLTEEAKLDVITYILENNGFPTGSAELTTNVDTLEGIQIVRKGLPAVIPNFAIVEVVGCAAPAPNGAWLLTSATEPVAAKDEESTPEQLQAAGSRQPGDQTFRLVSVTRFKEALQEGRRIEAKGLLYREPGGSRINLTSLQAVGSNCVK